MPEELQPANARGRGFESRLCRQLWQSSSEDRARKNFSTPCCQMYHPLTGGCRQDYIRSVIAGSIPTAGNGVNPANLAAHPFLQHGGQMPWKLHLSQVRVLPRFRRVAQSDRAIRRFQKTRCLPCCPLSTLSDDLKKT